MSVDHYNFELQTQKSQVSRNEASREVERRQELERDNARFQSAIEDDMERMRNEYTREIDRLNEQRRNDLAQIAERDLGKKAMKREMDKMKRDFDNDLARQKQQLQV